MYPQDFAFPHDELTPSGDLYNQHFGLTKREYLIIELLKAQISKSGMEGNSPGYVIRKIIDLADLLIEELS